MPGAGRQVIQLSVVIPAYNEAERIGPTVHRVLDYLQSRFDSYEVLVVVDGDVDDTAETVGRIGREREEVVVLCNEINRGKGFAVRQGVLAARGELVLFTDADLSTPIEELEPLLHRLRNGYDIAIASRGLADSHLRVRQPWWREAMGRTFNWFVKRLALRGIRDTQCGFKCFPRDVAQRIFRRQRIDRFGFDVEVLWIARRLGYWIAEVPVTWTHHPASKVHPLYDSARMLFDLARVRLYDWRGAYAERTLGEVE